MTDTEHARAYAEMSPEQRRQKGLQVVEKFIDALDPGDPKGLAKEIATQAEYDSLYAFAWDNYRRAERAEGYVARLREENRSLVQTVRRVLRGTPVGSGE